MHFNERPLSIYAVHRCITIHETYVYIHTKCPLLGIPIKRCTIRVSRLFAGEEHTRVRWRAKTTVAKKVKWSWSKAEGCGAPVCNFFFAGVASRQIAGATGRGNGRIGFRRVPSSRAAGPAVFGCALYASAEELRADISRAGGRCSHRRQKVQRRREREKVREGLHDGGGRKEEGGILVDWVTGATCIY